MQPAGRSRRATVRLFRRTLTMTHSRYAVTLALGATLLVARPVAAQHVPAGSARPFVTAATDTARDVTADTMADPDGADTTADPDTGAYAPSALVRIKNRAHTFGDHLS